MSHPVDTLPNPEIPAPAIPATGWTQERKALFLERLSAHGNARAACRAVGLSAEAAYKLRRRDPVFARGWAAALVLGREAAIHALGERAVEGVEEEIYFRGELIGTRRRYDSRLLLAHLARLDRLADEELAGTDAGRFDELLAAIARGEEPAFLPERAAFAVATADTVAEALRRRETDLYYHGSEDDDESDDGDGAAPSERTWDSEQTQEFFEILAEECAEKHAETLVEAGHEWDRRRAAVMATVDALASATGETARPLREQPPIPAILLAPPKPAAEAPARAMAALPWTLSTASTAALGRGLCSQAGTRNTTPLSPFSAPRRTGRR